MSPASRRDVARPAAERWSADEALEMLYVAHWRQLVRLAVMLLRDQGAAEEVVQDSFVAMHGSWRRLRCSVRRRRTKSIIRAFRTCRVSQNSASSTSAIFFQTSG